MKTDREKLIEFIDEWLGDVPYSEENLVGNLVDHLISKGVRIPVRCWECKHWDTFGHDNLIGECLKPLGTYLTAYDDAIETDVTDFCSYVERKEE